MSTSNLRRSRLTPAGIARWRPPAQFLGYIGGVVLAVVLAIWLTKGAWGGRPPSGGDTAAHLIRTRFASNHIVGQFRVDGWQPSFILGYQEFLFIGPFFTWAVIALHWLSFGLLSLTGAFKVVVIASFVALPLTVAYFARSLGLGRTAAGLAAMLALAVNSPFGGVGLDGLFNVGLITHQFAAPFFFLALGGALRVLKRPERRSMVLTAGSAAILLMAHGISVMIFGTVILILLAAMVAADHLVVASGEDVGVLVRLEVRRQLAELGFALPPEEVRISSPKGHRLLAVRGVLSLAVAGAFALAVAACVLLPYAAHRDLRGVLTAFSTAPLGERLAQIWRGQMLFRPGVAAFVLAGLIFAAWRVFRGDRKAFVLLVLPVGYLLVAYMVWHLWPNTVIAQQLPNRGLGYLGIFAVLPLAFLLARALGTLGRVGDVVAVVVAGLIVVLPLGPTRSMARQMPEPTPQLRAAAAELAQVVPAGSRFVVPSLLPSGDPKGASLTNTWLAWASDRETLDSFNLESSANPGAASVQGQLSDKPPAIIADELARFGTSHLVTVSNDMAERFAASSRFTEIWRQPPIAIFSVVPVPGRPPPSSLVSTDVPASARMIRAKPEHVVIDVDTSGPAAATVAIGWSPKWHAQLVGGPELKLDRDPEGLLHMHLPSGHSAVKLDFRSDVWDHMGLAVTIAALILGWACLRVWRRGGRSGLLSSRRRGRRQGAPEGRGEPCLPATQGADDDVVPSS